MGTEPTLFGLYFALLFSESGFECGTGFPRFLLRYLNLPYQKPTQIHPSILHDQQGNCEVGQNKNSDLSLITRRN